MSKKTSIRKGPPGSLHPAGSARALKQVRRQAILECAEIAWDTLKEWEARVRHNCAAGLVRKRLTDFANGIAPNDKLSHSAATTKESL